MPKKPMIMPQIGEGFDDVFEKVINFECKIEPSKKVKMKEIKEKKDRKKKK